LSDIASTLPFLALISWIDEMFFSKTISFGAKNTVGKLSSISASGQCFSSHAAAACDAR